MKNLEISEQEAKELLEFLGRKIGIKVDFSRNPLSQSSFFNFDYWMKIDDLEQQFHFIIVNTANNQSICNTCHMFKKKSWKEVLEKFLDFSRQGYVIEAFMVVDAAEFIPANCSLEELMIIKDLENE